MSVAHTRALQERKLRKGPSPSFPPGGVDCVLLGTDAPSFDPPAPARPVASMPEDFVAGARVERPTGVRVDMATYRGNQTFKFGE